MPDDDLRERLDRLDLERRVRLLTGADVWSLHPEPAVGLRRRATSLGPAADGDDLLELRTTEPWALADELTAYGADVVVEAPTEMRDAVVERLTRLAAMGETA